MIKNIKQQMCDLWLGPVDGIRLEAFRVLIGTALLLYMGFRWQYAHEWLTNSGFHISPAHLPYFDLTVPLLSPEWLPFFGVFFFVSILSFILGWQARWSSWIVLICLIYVSIADQLAFFSPNKVLMASLFVYAAATIGGGTHRATISAWPVRILQATIIIHLFMAGLSKISYGGEWLINPYVLWTQVQGTYRTDIAAFLLNRLPLWAWGLMQTNALLFELLAPYLFMNRRLRWIGIIWGVVFQLVIAATMKHLIYFNLIIMSFFILFVSDDTLHKIRLYFKQKDARSAPAS